MSLSLILFRVFIKGKISLQLKLFQKNQPHVKLVKNDYKKYKHSFILPTLSLNQLKTEYFEYC
jgi:hypothetical protein